MIPAVDVNCRVPRAMLTSPNCVAVPAANDYSRGRHRYMCDDLLVVDCDAVPKHDDFVVVFTARGPFGRVCHIAPLEKQSRELMTMGVLDQDGETIHMVDLGAHGRSFGVVVGVVPPK